ncbi:hypothetical protein [Jiulongibacter sp. NS-SX5]|uniref:hypothetical protein n=1 Tax=Jiulongibacter sp. NS-SX5 TaxID=3463854 RepID=UPI004059C8F8
MKRERILLFFCVLASFTAKAQIFGNLIPNQRAVSGKDGNYVFLIDEQYMLQNAGRFPDYYEKHPSLTVKRSTDGSPFVLFDTLKPVESITEIDEIFGAGSAESILKDTISFNLKSEEELIAMFQNPESDFKHLYFKPIEILRSVGQLYVDKNVEKGKSYKYQFIWSDTQKLAAEAEVTYGEENPLLDPIKLNFNQLSVQSIDSLVSGQWFRLKVENFSVQGINVYGKTQGESEFQLLDTQKPRYLNDTLLAGAYIKTKPFSVWKVFVRPVDIVGNEGIPSDTATLIAISKGTLPYVKNFTAKDTTSGVYLSWDHLPRQPYLSGYLLSREKDDHSFEVIDTIAFNTNYYLDFQVENGKAYNYEIQGLPSVVSNLRLRDFVGVRASSNFKNKERILPPQNLTVKQEGDHFLVHWSKVEDEDLIGYELMMSTEDIPERYTSVVGMISDTVAIDSIDLRDFDTQTRYYAVKSIAYNLSRSVLSESVTITPVINQKPERPEGLTLSASSAGIHLKWTGPLRDLGELKGYKIYKKKAGESLYYPLDTLVINEEFVDVEVDAGQSYYYEVTTINRFDLESPPSLSQEKTGKALFIAKLDNSLSKVFYRNIPGAIEVSWLVPENSEIKEILIYRMLANSPGEEYKMIANISAEKVRYWDKTAETGQVYQYAVACRLSDGTLTDLEHPGLLSRNEIEEE